MVALTWTLKDTLGDELDVLDAPVEFLVGGDDLLKRIEEALQGQHGGRHAADCTCWSLKMRLATDVDTLISWSSAPCFPRSWKKA